MNIISKEQRLKFYAIFMILLIAICYYALLCIMTGATPKANIANTMIGALCIILAICTIAFVIGMCILMNFVLVTISGIYLYTFKNNDDLNNNIATLINEQIADMKQFETAYCERLTSLANVYKLKEEEHLLFKLIYPKTSTGYEKLLQNAKTDKRYVFRNEKEEHKLSYDELLAIHAKK